MIKIEELLTPGESVIKKQGGVTLGRGIGPTGDLVLTNMRLLFIPSKLWALVIPDPKTLFGGGDAIEIALQDIKVTKKSWGALKVQAEKKYEFMVSVWSTDGWIDALQQVIRSPPPIRSQTPAPPQAPPTPSASTPMRRFCPNCGSPVKPEAKFCESCGTGLQ
jgi:hypothetical protein